MENCDTGTLVTSQEATANCLYHIRVHETFNTKLEFEKTILGSLEFHISLNLSGTCTELQIDFA